MLTRSRPRHDIHANSTLDVAFLDDGGTFVRDSSEGVDYDSQTCFNVNGLTTKLMSSFVFSTKYHTGGPELTRLLSGSSFVGDAACQYRLALICLKEC